MPPKHKKKLTESEILESLTKPDLSIDQTTDTIKDESLKDSETELPAIDLNPTKKTKRTGRLPKTVEHKKTEAEVLADVVAKEEDDDQQKPARTSRKKTVTETEPVTIEPPKKAARGRASAQADEPIVSEVEPPKKPGRKPGKKADVEEEQPAKKTPQKKGIKQTEDPDEEPVTKQSKKDVASSTAELEATPIKEISEEPEAVLIIKLQFQLFESYMNRQE